MANSIVGSSNPSIFQQFDQFRQTINGDPRQLVDQMLQRGQVTQEQVNQAMEMAKRMLR